MLLLKKIPWVALRTLLAQAVYGGKVDNEFDHRLLESFLQQLFTEKSFDAEFPLMMTTSETQKSLLIPEGTKRDQFMKWIENLPSTQSPTWLGLPENAESILLANQGKEVIRKLLKLQTNVEDITSSSTEIKKSDDKRPAWMISLKGSCENWLKALPTSVMLMERTAENIKNPLYRFFEREIVIGSKLLKRIRDDLQELIQVCDGLVKQTNNSRSLITSLTKGMIPIEWKKYPVPHYVSINVWIIDFGLRLQQLQEIRKSKDYGRASLWIGGLFLPEAYITATRQSAAQSNGWSLENLELEVEILNEGEERSSDTTSFIVKGISLEGAAWKNNKLSVSNDISTPIPSVRFTWKLKKENAESVNKLTIPVYLSDTRSEFLFSVDLPVTLELPKTFWYQRCVAMTTWKASV